ncbi:alpha-L-fucosidase 2 [Rhizobium aquaticum]|uniref:Alpha-L-fucosidase 2 n=1 Tax=Rhizobium aquaticum TaxID=1549636 RepID=A0ABV2J509_9HYPH
MTDNLLWYDEPARIWTDALPLGNGRLGGMVFGGVENDRVQINESTFWSGGPYNSVNPDAFAHLDEVRQAIFAGRYREAEAMASAHLMAKPLKQMSYQPVGDLLLSLEHEGPAASYRRALNLDAAIATCEYDVGEVHFQRETFADSVDGVLVLKLSASRPGSISLRLGLTSPQSGLVHSGGDTRLELLGMGKPEHGVAAALHFALALRVQAKGGTTGRTGDEIRVENADEVVVLLDAATNFVRFDDVSGDPVLRVAERLDRASSQSFERLRARHMTEHRRLFRSFALDLGSTAAALQPTDRRIAGFGQAPDPALAALYVQYGRYLAISSSRPGTQPANLQGIWNDEVDPPWGSKYTANINLQMNYWLAAPANLAECLEPLVALAEDLALSGRETARVHYNARGWVLHHNTDLWRATAPIDGPQWGLWPMGGVWLMVQLLDVCDYLDDADAMRARLLPLARGAAEFILDVLVPLPGTDYLVTNPSLSPENLHPGGTSICAGPAMDNQLLRDFFVLLRPLAAEAGEAELVAALDETARRLPPDRIGASGQLQEWLDDWDMQAPEIHHRHVSHLYGLYPSWQIDPGETPALAEAARRSLEIRGDDATGWGIGWRINLWARLRDGDHAFEVLKLLLSPERSYRNLFDAHPPFQIDGNFGGAAGILEMLVQSSPRELSLLPALPSVWPDGKLTGLRIRGGATLDLEWSDATPCKVKIFTSHGGEWLIRFGNSRARVNLKAGEARSLTYRGAAFMESNIP